MLQENYTLSEGQASKIPSSDWSDSLAPKRATSAIRLNTVLTVYAGLEFFAVAISTYFGSFLYHFLNWKSWQTAPGYVLAAAIIATLVLVISIGLHTFVSFQRQPRHIFLWRGLGSVALAFSIFVTILFFTQSGEAYSRGSLIFQVGCVGITLISARAFFYSWLQGAIASDRIEARRVVLIGDVSHCSKFSGRLKTSGVETIGTFQIPAGGEGSHANGHAIRQLISQIRVLRADDVIVLATNNIMPIIFEFTTSLGELPLGVHIIPVEELNALASLQIAKFDG